MIKNSIKMLFTLAGAVIISYMLFNNLTLSLSLLTIGILLFYLFQKNHIEKKENLNIIRDEEQLYFYLGDELRFSVTLSPNQNFGETLYETIEREMKNFEKMTQKISFINFNNHALLREVEQILHTNAHPLS